MLQTLRAKLPYLLATLCVATLLLISNVQSTQAQCSGAVCSPGTWGPKATYVLTLNNGCVVTVTMQIRTCTGTTPNTCEYFFDKIEGLCCYGSTPTTRDLVRSVAAAIISTLAPNTCNLANPKVFYPKCWQATGGTNNAEGCTSSPCCSYDGTTYTTPPTPPGYTCPSPCTIFVCP